MRKPRTAIAFLLAAAAIAGSSLCFAQHKRTAAAKEDAFLSGPPFSLNDILDRVGVISDRRLTEAITRRGVSFAPGKSDYEKVKAAGAGPDVLQAIAGKAPAAPRTPPKPVSAGALHFQCAPAECDVFVNGEPKGRTDKGAITLTGLPPGNVFIDFKKDGYIGQQLTITLRPGAELSRAVTLEPTAATQEALGRQVFLNIVARLGGADAIRHSQLVEESGGAVLYSGGQRTDWNASAKVKLPLLASIEITGAGLKWRTSVKAGDSKSDGTGRLKGSALALDMEKLARVYRDYQLAALIRRINLMHVSSPATTPDDAGHLTLTASGDNENYKLTLKPDATPLSVVYGSASGLGSGLEIVYADYVVVDKAWYPKTMAVKFPDQTQHGIELRFTDVRFLGSIPDREFHF